MAGAMGDGSMTVTGVQLLGYEVLQDGTYFDDTLVGGLSGMTYDPINDVYYVISDDKSEEAPARYYTISVGVDPTKDADKSVTVDFKDVTFLRNHGHLYRKARSTSRASSGSP